MESFQDLAKKKEKEQKKFSTNSFKAPANTKTRAIGGASPFSLDAAKRLETLETTVEEGGLGEDVSERIETVESDLGTVNQNLSSLDSATASATARSNEALNTVNSFQTILNNKADDDHVHQGTYLTEPQVRALVISLIGNAEPPATGDVPFIASGQYGSQFNFTQTWSDNFDQNDRETLFNRWHPDLMTEGLHQTGNQGRDGWRWSANYSKPEETSFVRDGKLHMRAYVEERGNPFRKAYTYRGNTMRPDLYWIYLSFLTTWGRVYDNDQNHHITNPAAPDRTWGPGTVFEIKMSLEEMRTQCCRISFYLLPAYENDSNAYSPDGTRGIENDFPELDFLDGYENYAQMKVISSRAAGNTPAGSIDLTDIIVDLNLQEGDHTFTLLWAKDRFVWYVNGIEVQRDTDPRRIPQVPHYVVISREANSGIRAQRNDGVIDNGFNAYSDGTDEMPEDVGIWGRPVYQEIEKLHNDTARIDSFKTFTFVDTSTAGVAIGDDTSGISPIMISGNPPTSWTPETEFTFQWDNNGRTVYEWFIEVGYTRGGNEMGSTAAIDPNRSFRVAPNRTYNGPINARLWFRSTPNDVWHWRDYGFSSGLQGYPIGTDGKVKVTVPASFGYVPTPPTVGGLGWVSGQGRDGTFANTITYPNGVTVPEGYVEGFSPGTGEEGEMGPDYSGTPTIAAVIPANPGLTYSQYPNNQGELLWPSPAVVDPADLFELTINGVVVQRSTANSFFVDGYPVGNLLKAVVRIVRDDGSFSAARELDFSVYTI